MSHSLFFFSATYILSYTVWLCIWSFFFIFLYMLWSWLFSFFLHCTTGVFVFTAVKKGKVDVGQKYQVDNSKS